MMITEDPSQTTLLPLIERTLTCVVCGRDFPAAKTARGRLRKTCGKDCHGRRMALHQARFAERRRSTRLPRIASCGGCGAAMGAGDRGPLPMRCEGCGGRRRGAPRARSASCGTCGAAITVGRRGRAATHCEACGRHRRQAYDAERRRLPRNEGAI